MPVPRFFSTMAWMLGVVLACVGNGCAGRACLPTDGKEGAAHFYSPPNLLPFTPPQMRTPAFWISRHPDSDKVILSADGIQRFNRTIREELKLTKDLSAWPSVTSGEELCATLQKILDDLEDRGLTLLDGKNPSSAYWSAVREALNIEAVPSEILRQYGLVVRYTDQRFLPFEEGLYAQANDIDFDELQNSALEIGTPVVILHGNLDGRWLWVESSTSAGWVRVEDVVAATESQMATFWSVPFVVVTAPKSDIYWNQEMTQFYGSVQMGARLPLRRLDGDDAEVTIPQRLPDGAAALIPGFMAAADTHEGYLPYTPRQILLQAFKMLHQPYGWGGMYGGQDCSRFLQEIFSTVGIELPRDSKNQIQTGQALAAWPAGVPREEKLRLLRESAVGGMTLLGMKGHIMLYLGTVDGRAYAIHSLWAYRRPRGGRDETFVVNRVAVSDLMLGEGSRRGALVERLNAVRLVR